MASFSDKSLAILDTCHPDLQKVLKEAIKYFDFTLIEGRRTLETQKKYVADGKSKTMNSKHIPDPRDPKQYSRAIDLTPYPIDYSDLQRHCYLGGWIMGIASQMGIKLRWGGDFSGDTQIKDESFKDYVHFELKE